MRSHRTFRRALPVPYSISSRCSYYRLLTTESVPNFSRLSRTDLRACSMKAFKNRNIFERWMSMRLGIVKGAHLLVAPLYSASFGPFLAETRKGHITTVLQICTLSNAVKKCRWHVLGKEKRPTTFVVSFVFALPIFTARTTIVTPSEQSGGLFQASLLHVG